jgi:hypothetical protein
MLIHNADITGSLTINGIPYNTGSFTGSFFGDGSQLSGVTSYTNADTLAFINSIEVVSGSIETRSTVSDTFTSVTSYTVTHNFDTKEVIVSVYENDTLIFPSSINTPTTNTVTITFPEPVTGRVVVVKAGHIVSGSINYDSVLNKPTLVSGSSQITYSDVTGIPSGIVSGSAQIAALGYATTGSNQFNGSQVITGSLTVTGEVVAQTLNVQELTSSIVFSSGSNIFGNDLGNTQQFTGSISITGSLTVNGSGLVPYTGATANVNLGNFDVLSRYLNAEGSPGLGGVLNIKQDAAYLPKGNGYSSIAASFTDFDFYGYTGASTYKNFSFRFDGLTDNTLRIYTLPNEAGTLALTSNLGDYLPLTGGTLTGALSGTSATFTGDITSSNGKFFVVNTFGYFFGDNSNLTGWQGSNGTQIIQGFTGGTEKMRIFSDGNLLIQNGGTFSNAGFKLDVNGTGRFKIDGLSKFGFDILNNAGSRGAGFYNTGGNNVQLYFYNSAGTEKIFLDGGTGAATFSSTLQTGGDISLMNASGDIHIRMKDSGGNADRVLLRQAGTNDVYVGDIDANGGKVIIRTNGNDVVTIASTGASTFSSTVTATNFITTSDRRLKSEIKEIKDAVSKLSKFKAYEYIKDDKQDAGFIAQEVQEVIPYSINTMDNGYLSMNDRPILALIHQAIIEINERLTKLENK